MIKNYLILAIFLFLHFNIDAQTLDDFHQKISQLSDESNFTGFSISILNSDSILFSNGYGYSNIKEKNSYQTNNTQIVASVSKTWIGLALMQCVEQGKFTLETDVNQILPFKVSNPNFPNEPITVRHLATHTSSIVYSIPDYHKIVFEEEPNMKLYSWREKRMVRKILKNQKIEMGHYLKNYLSQNGKEYNAKSYGKYAPGVRYQYSNMASTLAAHLVEIVSEMSFAEFCQKNIIAPLQLKNAAFNISNLDKEKMANQYFGKKQKRVPLYSHNFYPTGGLRISNDELSIFLMEIIKGYNGMGKLLTKENYAILLSENFTEKKIPENFPKNESNHGIFWTYRDNLIGHTGGGLGATTFMFFDKKTGIGKIFITNCELETNKKLVPQFLKIWKTMNEFQKK